MPSLVSTIPVLASILALTSAAELPLTPVVKAHAQITPGPPLGQRPAFPANSPGGHHQQQASVFKLTQVSSNPTVTGTPTQPDKCSEVAARITPQLTPKPTYPPALKAMADGMGGVEHDTCGNMDFNAKFKNVKAADLNRFTQARYSTFIVPIWAKVHQLYTACGEDTRKIQHVAQDPCYRWALDLSKSSNESEKNKGDKSSNKGGKNEKDSGVKGNVKTPDLESDAGRSGISDCAAVGALGMLTLVWAVLLA